MKNLKVSYIAVVGLFVLLVATCSSSASDNHNNVDFVETSAIFSQSQTSLELELRRFANDPSLKNAAWGFVVVDMESGKTIAQHNPHLSLVPASALKIITTASALQILGSNYKYETILGFNGKIDPAGTLNGNLIIKGSGDPSFGSSEVNGALKLEDIFASWLKALENKGVKKINGQVIADESIFDYELIPRQWIWEDMGNYFGAGASGLAVNENMYTVYFQPGSAVGSPARVISNSPVVPDMTFVNQVTTGPRNSGDQVYIFGSPYQNQRTLTGTVPLGSNNFPVRGSIPDPPLFVAQVFHQFLISNGVEVSKGPTNQRIRQQNGMAPQDISQVIAKHTSPTLAEIVYRTNLRSVNTLAENIIKTIGLKEKGEGSFKNGIETIMEFWQKKRLDTDGMFLFDGSGLSPANRITAAQLVQVMVSALEHSSGKRFAEGLPLAGQTGTLARLFQGTKSDGVLRAKSGFLNNVRAYAGYTINTNGRKLAFALIVNNFSGSSIAIRDKMITLMDAVTNSE